MARTNFDQLLEAGVHFGHLKRKWNPKMAPYIFLEKNGVEVTTIVDMNPERRFIPTLDPGYVYQQTKKLDKTGADGIFVSCTALDCMGVIRYMEEDFGLPVVTSHQASSWASLRAAGVGTRRDDLGKLWTC